MPNSAHIPGKDNSYSAVRLSQLEGLGYGPDLKDENLAMNQAGPNGEGRNDSKTSEQKEGRERPIQTGYQKDSVRNYLLNYLAEGSGPELI